MLIKFCIVCWKKMNNNLSYLFPDVSNEIAVFLNTYYYEMFCKDLFIQKQSTLEFVLFHNSSLIFQTELSHKNVNLMIFT